MIKKNVYKMISILLSIILCTSIIPAHNITITKKEREMDILSLYTNKREYIKETEIEEEYTFIPTITVDRTEDDVIKDYRYIITDKEFKEFVRVVEAEVTGSNPFGVGEEEAYKSKLRVAQVILNRVESPRFPNTVHDVIFQKNAFTPLIDGRYYEVEIDPITIKACEDALLTSTKDLTRGCEFFSSGTKTCLYGSYVYTDAVGHSFFKYY